MGLARFKGGRIELTRSSQSTSKFKRLRAPIVRTLIALVAFGLIHAVAPSLEPTRSVAPVVEAEGLASVASQPLAASDQASQVGAVLPPSAGSAPASPIVGPLRWRGTAARDANVRSAPGRSAPIVRELKVGESIEVVRWVSG